MSTKAVRPLTAFEAVAAGSPPILMLLVDLTTVMTVMVLRRRQ